MKNKLKFIVFLIFSMFVGILNGLFGGGGGMICVPMLKLLLNFTDKKAHATTIFIMALISIPTLIVYITTIPISISNLLFVTLGVTIGGVIGAKLLNKFSDDTINILFIIFVLSAGIKLVIG